VGVLDAIGKAILGVFLIIIGAAFLK